MPYLLIVDDDEDFANAIAVVLRQAGHEVAIELDTEGALTSMGQRPPDLVILDVMFPEDPSAGFQLAREMRSERHKLQDVPILILTAVNTRFPLGFSSRDIAEGTLWASDFLEKPVDLDVLTHRVSALLASPAAPAPGEQ